MTTSQFDDLGQGNFPPDRLCLWLAEVLHHDCQDLNVLPVTWGTFTSSSCHGCCRWQKMTTWTNAPSTDICLNSQPESCSWDSEGLEELCTSPVPGDNVSGFLLCSVGKSLTQMSTRTIQGPAATRMERDTALSTAYAVTGLLASLRMPKFWDLANTRTVDTLLLWP